MGGRLRRFGAAARKAAAPLVFATMLPMCAPAHALPRKEIPTQVIKKSNQSQRIPTSLGLRAGFDIAEGSFLLANLCKKNINVLKTLQRLSDIDASKLSKAEKQSKLMWDIRVFNYMRSHPNPSTHDEGVSLILASIKSNYSFLKTLSIENPRMLGEYLSGIRSLGFPRLAKNLKQWILNVNADKLYEMLFGCICR